MTCLIELTVLVIEFDYDSELMTIILLDTLTTSSQPDTLFQPTTDSTAPNSRKRRTTAVTTQSKYSAAVINPSSSAGPANISITVSTTATQHWLKVIMLRMSCEQ